MATVIERKYKICLIGNGKTGKTSFVKKIRTGDFENKYVATLGVEVYPVRFSSNYGTIVFGVWDTAGQSKYGGLRDGYYVLSHAAIVFTEENVVASLEGAENYTNDFTRVCPNVPVVRVTNKVDDHEILSNMEDTSASFRLSVKYDDVTTLSSPFLALARLLTGYEDLVFE